MQKYQRQIVLAIFLMVFASWFSHNVKADLNLIFQKDLLFHDESSNSVVSANITRKFFPPMVRVNSLNDQQGIWMEGPHWQHIPPLFAYVPYLFYQLDGHITIEAKRLSFAFLILISGLLFITIVYSYSKNLLHALAALLASILWISTPFTHELITGYAFGVSDIALAFASILAFGGLLWYLHDEKASRINYPWKKLALISLLVILPVWAKNLLGAIPAAIFVALLLWDHRRLSRKAAQAFLWMFGFLAIYYLPLLIASPAAFRNEILISFFHAGNYEGWGRPWHYYFSNYLPQRYLFRWTQVYWIGLSFSAAVLYIKSRKLARKDFNILALALIWFAINLAGITITASKIPNFIFQSYLLSLFAVVFAAATWLDRWKLDEFNTRMFRIGLAAAGTIILLFTIRSYYRLDVRIENQRAAAYSYDTEREKFYQLGEWMQEYGVNERDLSIVRVSDNDCWLRYNIIFLTGAESRTLLEMHFISPEGETVKQKYKRIFFVIGKGENIAAGLPVYQRIELPNHSLLEFDIQSMGPGEVKNLIAAFVSAHRPDIQASVERIKADKASCQWLVPDPILNSPEPYIIAK